APALSRRRMHNLSKFLRSHHAAIGVEYAVLVSLIAFVSIDVVGANDRKSGYPRPLAFSPALFRTRQLAFRPHPKKARTEEVEAEARDDQTGGGQFPALQRLAEQR